MKTLNTLLTATLFALVSTSAQAEARSDTELYNIIHPESADIFNVGDYKKSSDVGILSYGDDHNQGSVWSTEYEQYVNPSDFQQEVADTDDINRYMGSNPTASGGRNSHEAFIYNEVEGAYHLQ